MKLVISFILLFFKLNGNDILTNPSQGDGFGSQFQEIISAVIYAELTNNTFVYTPFSKLEHNYENDPDFAKKKEWLINFYPNFPINYDLDLQKRTNSYKGFVDQNAAACANSNALKKIKTIFRQNKDRSKYFDPRYLHIAIHVRRPNSHDNRIAGANTPDIVYLNLMNYLRTKHQEQSPLFHIYSQGQEDTFKQIYNSEDVVLHINESVEDSFAAMVLADVLVISPSSFSYAAALISNGVVYYIPFWHSPLPGWIPFN